MDHALLRFETNLNNLNEKLSLLAHVDPLTRILNRRSMNDFIEAATNNAHPTGSRLAFIVSDIDLFKNVNDNYGHACGDMVLEKAARAMADTIRDCDRVARWGGEEFLAVISRSTPEGGIIIAERMRKNVNNAVINFNGSEIRVTMTFGVCIGGIDESAKKCIDRADRALYHGKITGRNKVVFWTPELGD